MKSLVLLFVLGVAAISALEDEYQPGDKNKFLIGVRRTAIVTTLSTSTVTVGSTCYSQIETKTCQGKRRRRAVTRDDDIMANINDDGIEGSKSSEPIEISNADGQLNKLVIWTTSTTTITWYSSSTKSGTTLSLNYSCTASGMSVVGKCG
ncbi:unnamed protein product [Meganyctiphanes norvegica]|uniref:Uncharacterized protein n=1 Tax=Meganyctiphanes norvegica TaxID=48144 RepID=A0AAV2Q582_MEGNR